MTAYIILTSERGLVKHLISVEPCVLVTSGSTSRNMNTSINNRKYITSTGILLNSLKEDQSNTNLFQSPPQQTQMSQHHHHHGFNQQQQQQQQSKMTQHAMQSSYQQQSYQQQNFNPNFTSPNLQFQSNVNYQQQQQQQQNQSQYMTPNQLTKSSPQLISQITPNNTPMEFYQMKMQQQSSGSSMHQSQMHASSNSLFVLFLESKKNENNFLSFLFSSFSIFFFKKNLKNENKNLSMLLSFV